MPSAVVTIPVEAKVRELDEKVALAARLAADHHEIVLGPNDSVDAFAVECGSDVHMVTSAVTTVGRLKTFPRLARRGTKILVLDTEGANQLDSETVRARFDPRLVRHVYRYLAWGSGPAALAVKAGGFREDQVVVTGLPRFDTLRTPYEEIHRPARERLRRDYGRFILINTNHTRANPFAPGVVSELTPDLPGLANQRALMTAYETALPEISKRLPDVTVILRPHPGENLGTYEKMIAGLPRIKVVHEGSVQPWIKEAIAVVHNNCLTGVEAALAGTPVVAFSTTGWRQADFTVANEVSTLASNVDELVALLARAVAVDERPLALTEAQRAAMQTLVGNLTSLAVDAVAGVVKAALADGRARRGRPSVRSGLRRAAVAALGPRGLLALRQVRHVRDRSRLAYSLHKMNGITHEELDQRFRLLQPAAGVRRFEIRPVFGFENLFRITAR